MNSQEAYFLRQSNYIESEFSEEAFEDSVKAWDFIMEHVILDTNKILDIHRILLKRINPRIAGKLRDCDVWIGGEKKKFISKSILGERLDEVCEKINATIISSISGGVKELNDKAKDLHIEFEDIHPFEDGNGRTGRIIMNWHRKKIGLPILAIKADMEAGGGEQLDYYKWFQKKSK